jgi:hypothetical protein
MIWPNWIILLRESRVERKQKPRQISLTGFCRFPCHATTANHGLAALAIGLSYIARNRGSDALAPHGMNRVDIGSGSPRYSLTSPPISCSDSTRKPSPPRQSITSCGHVRTSTWVAQPCIRIRRNSGDRHFCGKEAESILTTASFAVRCHDLCRSIAT